MGGGCRRHRGQGTERRGAGGPSGGSPATAPTLTRLRPAGEVVAAPSRGVWRIVSFRGLPRGPHGCVRTRACRRGQGENEDCPRAGPARGGRARLHGRRSVRPGCACDPLQHHQRCAGGVGVEVLDGHNPGMFERAGEQGLLHPGRGDPHPEQQKAADTASSRAWPHPTRDDRVAIAGRSW